MPKSPKNSKTPIKKHQQGDTSKFSRLVTIGSVIVVGLGFVASVLTLLPRIVVNSGPQIDQFSITNTGYVPLTNVKPAIGMCKIQMKNRPLMKPMTPCDQYRGVRLSPNSWFMKQLGLDEGYTIRLFDAFEVLPIQPPFELEEADITIVIGYNPWIIPLRQEAEFRFFTRKENDGSLSWMQRPLLQ